MVQQTELKANFEADKVEFVKVQKCEIPFMIHRDSLYRNYHSMMKEIAIAKIADLLHHEPGLFRIELEEPDSLIRHTLKEYIRFRVTINIVINLNNDQSTDARAKN